MACRTNKPQKLVDVGVGDFDAGWLLMLNKPRAWLNSRVSRHLNSIFLRKNYRDKKYVFNTLYCVLM